MMLCENCKKNTATTYFKQTINGKTSEVFLCSECAAKLGLSDNFSGFGFDSVFAPFFGRTSIAPSSVCPTCGMSLTELSEGGKTGCPECYHAFREHLASVIQRVSGNKKHCGKTPQALRKEETELEQLRRKLEEAVAAENFEEATILRDKIRDLEKNV